MNALRLEADESASKVEELQAKVKQLEQENLSKEQEITSLQHKQSVLEQDNEKLEEALKKAKADSDMGAQHGTQNESLQRKLQVMEEEAESNDKLLRETNEKYASYIHTSGGTVCANDTDTGSVKRTSRPVTTSAKSRLSRASATNGSRSTKRWRASTPTRRRSSTTLSRRLVISRAPAQEHQCTTH